MATLNSSAGTLIQSISGGSTYVPNPVYQLNPAQWGGYGYSYAASSYAAGNVTITYPSLYPAVPARAESDFDWLRKRVREITDLAPAA